MESQLNHCGGDLSDKNLFGIDSYGVRNENYGRNLTSFLS